MNQGASEGGKPKVKQYFFMGHYNGKRRIVMGHNLAGLVDDAGLRFDKLAERFEFELSLEVDGQHCSLSD